MAQMEENNNNNNNNTFFIGAFHSIQGYLTS